jgi:hypothetical protein
MEGKSTNVNSWKKGTLGLGCKVSSSFRTEEDR